MGQRLLVLRPGALGDTLVTLPALAALRARFPGATVEMVGNAGALPLVQAAGVIDRWLSFDDARVTRLFMPGAPRPDDAFLGLDVAVAWGRDPDAVLGAALRQRGAARIVVAPSQPAPEQPLHVARHLLNTLAPLGVEADGALVLPEIRLPADADASAAAELAAAGLMERPFVAVHAGSGSPSKNWPATHFAQVIHTLSVQHGVPCVVLCGPAEADLGVVLAGAGASAPTLLVERPLLVVAAILRRARAFLGNDSGLAHLAGLLGVPTLALFGPTDPVRWAPLGPRVRTLRAASLAALEPATVLAALMAVGDRA